MTVSREVGVKKGNQDFTFSDTVKEQKFVKI